MDSSPPDSFVCEILQVRILEWIALPSIMGSSHSGTEPVSYVKIMPPSCSLQSPTPNFISFPLIKIFYLWLCWVFVAVQPFSRCSEQGLLLSCGTWTSPWDGFSCCGAWALGHVGSVLVAYGLSCSAACGIFPDQGLNLGGFFTIGTSERPKTLFSNFSFCFTLLSFVTTSLFSFC